jgi:cytoskeletal protein CcmA (bactofilin family)
MFRRNEEERHEGPIQPREVRRGSGDAASDVTVVGPGAKLDGTVVSTGSLRIEGEVRGKVSAEGDVILTQQSHVEADIHASNVMVAGAFIGNIVSKGRTELAAGGRVDGNITSASLVIAEGAVFSGQSVMEGTSTRGGAKPAKEPQRSEAAVGTEAAQATEQVPAR